MTYRCPLCTKAFTKKNLLKHHLSKKHAGERPYVCSYCDQSFTQEANYLRHAKDNHDESHEADVKEMPSLEEPRPEEETEEPSPEESQATSFTRIPGKRWSSHMEQKADLVGYCSSWTQWSQQYQLLRGQDDTSLSRAYAHEVERTFHQFQEAMQGMGQAIPWKDWDELQDWLDAWAIPEVSARTRADYFRRLAIYSTYLFARHEASLATVKGLTRTAKAMQQEATHEQQCASSVSMLHPDALIALRNRIVVALNEKATVYEEKIATYIRERPEKQEAELLQWGLHLRCFIELYWRFSGVALRTQCSRHLYYEALAPEQKHTDPFRARRHVCQLVLQGGRWYRIVDYDKTKKSQKPLRLRMDRVTSVYLWFYIHYCRPKQAKTGLVFVGERGGLWERISHDLLQYINQELHIETAVFGFRDFIHKSRQISLACYASQVNFDQTKLHRYATLMRHSFETCNRHYQIWSSWQRARLAQEEFVSALNQQDLYHCEPEDNEARIALALVPVRIPKPIVLKVLEEEMHQKQPPSFCLKVRSIGVQTDTEVDTALSDQEWNPLNPLPRCLYCHSFWSYVGPITDLKSKHYGQYWAGCRACGQERTFSWVPVGWSPTHLCYKRSSKKRKIQHSNSS